MPIRVKEYVIATNTKFAAFLILKYLFGGLQKFQKCFKKVRMLFSWPLPSLIKLGIGAAFDINSVLYLSFLAL